MPTQSEPTTLEEIMESRIAELELKLAGAASPSENSTTNVDISSRLDKLMRSATDAPPTKNNSDLSPEDKAKVESKRLALHEEYRTIDRLLSELAISPIAGPTVTASSASSNNAPMAYRRMEVLASAESMKKDMELLSRIRELTAIGTKEVAGQATTIPADSVVNCPIISSERYNLLSNPEAIGRLEKLCLRVAKLNQGTVIASKRVDEMVNSYGEVMRALSEKLVLAEEQIKS